VLLDELERIFSAEGFAYLNVADLPARLHVSRSTLYRLAAGKQELAELVIDRMFNRMGKRAPTELEGLAGPRQEWQPTWAREPRRCEQAA
jgi:AcrR family transcriptional regulator